MNLADALTQYLGSATPAVEPYAHQELHRFGRAIGLDKDVLTLAPPEVAHYAEEVVAAGGDIQGRLAPLKEFLAFLKKKEMSSYSLHPHVKIPRATVRAAAASREAQRAIQMTDAGMRLLSEELKELKGQRVEIVEAIRLAAADKDFRENAPLDAARETQGKTEGRIRELEETLRRAVLVSTTSGGTAARVGATVVLLDLSSGKPVTYKLTDSADADPAAGKVSIDSPVGKAVIGTTIGQEVAVQTPKGERRYKLNAIK